jgi:predicted DNA-binding transcriptional regulator YafY
MQLVVVRYAAPGTEPPATRILCPYGILYGGRGWLVAHVEALPDLRLWRLDRIASVDLLDRGFARREDFSLADYAARSFGVFQEEPMDVLLRFTPDAAEDAAGWMFHPSQKIEREADGGLVVRFRAGGIREMCWHMFTWGEGVEILKPQELREIIAATSMIVSKHHTTSQKVGGAVNAGPT